jgi:hypothetical protein
MKRSPTSVLDKVGKDDDVFQCEKIVGKLLAMIVHFVTLPRKSHDETRQPQNRLKIT